MTVIANLLLRDAPDDRAHLLLWDTPNEPELRHISTMPIESTIGKLAWRIHPAIGSWLSITTWIENRSR